MSIILGSDRENGRVTISNEIKEFLCRFVTIISIISLIFFFPHSFFAFHFTFLFVFLLYIAPCCTITPRSCRSLYSSLLTLELQWKSVLTLMLWCIHYSPRLVIGCFPFIQCFLHSYCDQCRCNNVFIVFFMLTLESHSSLAKKFATRVVVEAKKGAVRMQTLQV